MMQLRQYDRSGSRPTSPAAKQIGTLPDIPEASPGPNAFAQQARRMERHRLDGNAFYQQEVEKRRATPPTAVHPALRPPRVPDPPLQPVLGEAGNTRDSQMTTMSPFINAGKEMSPFINAGKKISPQLQLGLQNEEFSRPTERAYLEERHEKAAHEVSGSCEERTPVYIYSPKKPSSDFRQQHSTPGKKIVSLTGSKGAVSTGPLKSPKKSIFDRFRKTNKSNVSLSPNIALGEEDRLQGERLSSLPKAKAVLGSPPMQPELPRSPSKRRNFFSPRRTGNVGDLKSSRSSSDRQSTDTGSTQTKSPELEWPNTASTGQQVYTPQTSSTSFTEPSRLSSQARRVLSQSLSKQNTESDSTPPGKCAIGRSQSLRYFDHAPPPTPPAKNTPEEEKINKGQASQNTANRMPHRNLPDEHDYESDKTPSKLSSNIVSISDRLSPTKYGSYGHRDVPTLVTKKSMHSLHASVVPEMIEIKQFEDLKARVDGLGLEGFSLPGENFYRASHSSPEMVYSPSIYSNEWDDGPKSVAFGTPRKPYRRTVDDLPALMEEHFPDTIEGRSCRTKKSSSSSGTGGTIPVFYPGIASDPSLQNLRSCANERSTSATTLASHASDPSCHGVTHSRDHSDSPNQSVGDVSIFAMPCGQTSCMDTLPSPSESDLRSSAMPSPLHFLPATTYTPPPKKSAKANGKQSGNKAHNDEAPKRTPCQKSDLPAETTVATPSRGAGIFETAPILSAPATSTKKVDPRPSPYDMTYDANETSDPTKTSLAYSSVQSLQKIDQVIEMLKRMDTRDNELQDMQKEMMANASRLGERLTTIEKEKQTSAPKPPGHDLGASSEEKTVEKRQLPRQRVVTEAAHSFYRPPAPRKRSRKVSKEGNGIAPKTEADGGSVGVAHSPPSKVGVAPNHEHESSRDAAHKNTEKKYRSLEPRDKSTNGKHLGTADEKPNKSVASASLILCDGNDDKSAAPVPSEAVPKASAEIPPTAEPDTIAALQENNRALQALVHGLALQLADVQRQIEEGNRAKED